MEQYTQPVADVLYILSNLFLLPVLVALLACLAWVLQLCGGFLREWAGRRSFRQALGELVAACEEPSLEPEAMSRRLRNLPGNLVRRLTAGLSTLPASPTVLRKRLGDVEGEVSDALACLTFLTRVGPMLGLLGTLIPLGPALSGLSSGDVRQLSSNLIVAFTTTIMGLVVSCLAYGMGLVRRSWYGRDLDDLDFIANRLYPGEH